MPYRDENGHFISEAEARRRGMIDEPPVVEEDEATTEPTPVWGGEGQRQSINVETGRGQTVEVQAGAPFEETLNRIGEEAHYGGYFRVFLNGSEVINPEDAPATIEPGMRIAITAYDKVGLL